MPSAAALLPLPEMPGTPSAIGTSPSNTTRRFEGCWAPSTPSRAASSSSPMLCPPPAPRTSRLTTPSAVTCAEVDLPGRPSGNADTLRAAAHAWDHLAWEVWQLSRALEVEADGLAQGWSGAAGDAYADVWRQVRRGFYDLDGRIHDVAGRLRRAADAIEGGQSAYDRALAAVGIATVAGIGLTVLTLGLSDAAAAEADSAIAAAAATIIADLEATLARVAALFAESADAIGGLASRFAVNFAMRAPELAYGPAGGGAMGVGFALASGARDPRDLAASGLLGAAENTGGIRRSGNADTELDQPAFTSGGRSPGVLRQPTETMFSRLLTRPSPSDGEAVWQEISTPDGQLVGVRGQTARPSIHEVSGDLATAKAYFDRFASEGVDITKPGTDGMIQFRDGSVVTFRAQSKSGPPTLDFNIVGRGHFKLKFVDTASMRGGAS
jgi:WXG100 family type VII secretion target